MTDCIYCNRLLVKGATDGSQPSREHVVQYGIGGSNGLSTWDVCTDCNSRLGETVDADFINQQLIAMLRQQQNLSGYGKKPTIVSMEARSVDSNEPGRMLISVGAEVTVKHEPVVISQAKSDGTEEWLVAAQPEDAERIADGLIKKAKKTGRKILTASGREALTARDLMAEGEPESFEHYRARIEVDQAAMVRGCAKIAFGFMHVLLGPAWTSSSLAEPLRRLILEARLPTDWKRIVKQATPEIRALFVGPEPADTTTHLVGMLPEASGTVVVSLFGGAFSFAFVAGPLSDDQLIDAVTEGTGIAVLLEPSNRSTRWVPFTAVVHHMIQGAAQTSFHRG